MNGVGANGHAPLQDFVFVLFIAIPISMRFPSLKKFGIRIRWKGVMPGEVAEWSIAPDLKSGEGKLSGSSNLPLSVFPFLISN